MNYKKGEVVWVKFPLSDKPNKSKIRPGLILANCIVNPHDYIIAQITSNISGGLSAVEIDDEQLVKKLPVRSEVRSDYIATIRSNQILDVIGEVSYSTQEGIVEKVIALLKG